MITLETSDTRYITKLIAPVILGLILWHLPVPEGLEPKAIHMLAIFAATIFAVILSPLPMSVIALSGAAVAVLVEVIGWKDLYSSNGTNLVWLVLMAFFISKGIIKSGLGRRIALWFIKLLGKRTVGLGYGMAFTDLILSPAMPSITARAGGVMLPISRSISEAFDSHPKNDSRHKIGSYLIQSAFLCNVITASMFITAMAGNPLAVKLAGDQGVEISWLGWATAAFVPGIICLLATPVLLMYLNKPDITETPDAVDLARQKLNEMGPISRNEIISAVIFVSLLFLWIAGNQLFGIGSGLAATMGVCALLITRVIKWQDALEEKSAWDTMVWIGILIMMAAQLKTLGLVDWFGGQMGGALSGFSPYLAYIIVAAIYFYIHYFFASATAHISALYAVSMAILVASGVNPFMAAITLACLSNIYGCLTPYAIGSAPVMFGAGYVTQQEWLKNGFIMSVFYLLVWFIVGPIWWQVIGQM